MTVSELPNMDKVQNTCKVSVMFAEAVSNSVDAKCYAWLGRRWMAMLGGRVRVFNVSWRASRPLTFLQANCPNSRSHDTNFLKLERWNACKHFKFEDVQAGSNGGQELGGFTGSEVSFLRQAWIFQPQTMRLLEILKPGRRLWGVI